MLIKHFQTSDNYW